MAGQKTREGSDTEGEVLTKPREKTKMPRRYVVLMHNDDYTTQEFVVHVLMKFFQKPDAEAHRLMLQVHTQKSARVGVFTKDIAMTKVSTVMDYARQNGMPLLLSAEPE
jgi:ATP-dependent Clp protease adaptor protein ClpS